VEDQALASEAITEETCSTTASDVIQQSSNPDSDKDTHHFPASVHAGALSLLLEHADEKVREAAKQAMRAAMKPMEPEDSGAADARFKLIARVNKNKGHFPQESLASLVHDVNHVDSGKHMIVGNLSSKDYLQNGEYIFKLVFKSASRKVQMEWAQTSWLTSSNPTGFRPIAISDTQGEVKWNDFTGLRSGASQACLCSTRGWWAAVGQKHAHAGGIPAWPDERSGTGQFIADTAELFIDCSEGTASHVSVTEVELELDQESSHASTEEAEGFVLLSSEDASSDEEWDHVDEWQQV
jgi:hypothetical protein